LETLYEKILHCIGEDVQREGLIKTPRRAADAIKFMTQGYRQDIKDILNNAIFDAESDDIIIVRDIEFYSICEHHILPFFGKCHVGYIPNGKIIGLSKVPRIVDMFARRLQVQERLTHQIASALNEALDPLGVAVVMEAQHMCMMIRGVQKQNSKAITSAVLGVFRDDSSTKAEWMSLLQIS
jgi:GTP cyclohydrolase I